VAWRPGRPDESEPPEIETAVSLAFRRRRPARSDPRSDRTTRRRESLWRRLSAPQIFVGSFALLIGVGTLGLQLLPGLQAGPRMSWLDALFTMTSAVCVTGLIVVDTATAFTAIGQAWILLFIQLGGLGIITFATLLTFALGQRLSLRGEELSSGGADVVAPHLDVRRLTRDVVVFTLGMEALGAIALYALWAPDLGYREAAWPALFHSISAFCNAGFSTYTDSLMGHQRAPATLLVIAGLIVIGGLGFVTLEELYLRRQYRRVGRRPMRLSIHSRLVLTTTAILILAAWPPLLALEWNGQLGGLPAYHKPVNALFLSVTPRTAGFNTIDYGRASDTTNFLTILLMTIGGSPGSTAGGLKTTTFAVLGILAWSRFRGRAIISAWSRTIPDETFERAAGLTVGVVGILVAGVFVLTLSEDPLAGGDGRFLKYLFEATSAFNTVGLSMGITAGLSGVGKATMIVMMFVGRVGPATAAAALSLSGRRQPDGFRFASENVAIG
jgi:trk system potassium uptake protein TrkH